METEEIGQLPFLDVLLSKQSVSDRQGSFITSVYRKKTFTGLLTNYFSLTPFKYKLGLIKTVIDRAYKINNTTQGFHNDIKNLSEILKRNMFPKWLIDKSVKGYLSKVTTTGKDASKGGVALERIFFFGRSERPKNIGTDQFFWAHFPVAHEAKQQD